MWDKLSELIFKVSYKTRVWLILLYIIPALLDILDQGDLYFHNVLWFFYLIPTIIIVFNKGMKWGFMATAASSIILLVAEEIQSGEIFKHEVLIFIELMVINSLITLAVGTQVKKTHEKQQQLTKTQNLLSSIFNNLDDIGIWSINQNKRLLASRGIQNIYGFPPEFDVVKNDFWKKSILPEDAHIADEIDRRWAALEEYEYEYRIFRANGEIRWIRDHGIPVLQENGSLLRYDGSNIDITKQKELEIMLKESEEKYKNLLQEALVGVFLLQNNRLVFVNRWIAHILGIPEQELLNTNIIDFLHPDDQARLRHQFEELLQQKKLFFKDEFEIYPLHGGESVFLELQVSLSTINGESAIVGIAMDVTDKRKALSTVEYIAYHDSLTGLLNMNYFHNRISKKLQDVEKPIHVMFFNLDRFKLINDAFGHQIGDELLRLTADRLRQRIEPAGKVIRAGGDDFILYLPNTSKNQAESLAISVLGQFAEPIYFEKQEVRLSASIGIAELQPGDSMEDTIKRASSALHFAKEYGRNQYQFFQLEYGKLANRRLQLEQRLRKAFEKNELELFYQPKLDLLTNQVNGMEALLRWNDEQLGPVSPAEFIPVAEETGLIIPIGKWVLETACRQNKEWQLSGLPLMQVCVNISGKQFLQDDFVPMVERILTEYGLAPESLNLEITEGIALYNIEDAIHKLEQLKQLRIGISLDDFGTGYSSLSYIKSLPIHYLKIDRSFIIGISYQARDAAIVESTISLAHSLGFKVVAEGIEDKQQFGILGELGCDEIQGYYIAKPMNAAEFRRFIEGKQVQYDY